MVWCRMYCRICPVVSTRTNPSSPTSRWSVQCAGLNYADDSHPVTSSSSARVSLLRLPCASLSVPLSSPPPALSHAIRLVPPLMLSRRLGPLLFRLCHCFLFVVVVICMHACLSFGVIRFNKKQRINPFLGLLFCLGVFELYNPKP